jgi:hypothetical protein
MQNFNPTPTSINQKFTRLPPSMNAKQNMKKLKQIPSF